MMSPKKLMKMAGKWKKPTTSGRKRISHPGVNVEVHSSLEPETGHFVIYTIDGGRFTIPLQCLHSNIFQALFMMSEEEFGLSGDGPITMPCDTASMEYIVSLVRRCIAKGIERALLNSIAFTPCSFAAAVHNKCLDQQVPFLAQ
ncbi:auxin-responsive protein SAUR68-like [Rhodamnia argentea]|uniref:Auxin-responsive protein SAUR68-like n=1 Tax=Rhodamnia argentea TaxID=178133 RepID=A0ABM3HG74_9MYRT|nr:auxin-responsive protein SAUR68-like [Rhodamnia argentea]